MIVPDSLVSPENRRPSVKNSAGNFRKLRPAESKESDKLEMQSKNSFETLEERAASGIDDSKTPTESRNDS